MATSLKNTKITSTDALVLPSGTTAQRPGSPTAGMIRYNTDLGYTEVYKSNAWVPLSNKPKNNYGFVSSVSTSKHLTWQKENHRIHAFVDGIHRFTPKESGEIELLVVGGGGAGGNGDNGSGGGGGGGAGGLITKEKVIIEAGTEYTVVVGAGGDYPTFGVTSTTRQGKPSAFGVNIVRNGTFDSDSEWSKDSAWTIANGKATSDGTGTPDFLYQSGTTNQGSQYLVAFEITDYTSGSLEISFDTGNATFDSFNSAGIYSVVSTVTGNEFIYFRSNNFVGSIDNVVIIPVDGLTDFVAFGGGYGGISDANTGGSGGGNSRSFNGASGTSGQGNSGGDGGTIANVGGGGGGGAGGPGQSNPGDTTSGRNGGPGLSLDISGETRTYAAGGGGGPHGYAPKGVGGGKGAGIGSILSEGLRAELNTGHGGGGAGGNEGTSKVGGQGGSGVVFIKYEVDTPPPISVEFITPGTHTWTAPTGVTSVEALIVAGGGSGAGGTYNGGGGGAGGVINTFIPVTPGQSYTVSVGSGGARSQTEGNDGSNSAFDTWTAIGGGGGGAHPGNPNDGRLGGSGGGGSQGTSTGGSGTQAQGNDGAGQIYAAGGGGGGAGTSPGARQSGNDGSPYSYGKDIVSGGQGLPFTTNGAFRYYGGGGGGGGRAGYDVPVGYGGTGGGGMGGDYASLGYPGQDGHANTGGGGGGAGGNDSSNSTYGGAGGSGVVVLRYYPGQ